MGKGARQIYFPGLVPIQFFVIIWTYFCFRSEVFVEAARHYHRNSPIRGIVAPVASSVRHYRAKASSNKRRDCLRNARSYRTETRRGWRRVSWCFWVCDRNQEIEQPGSLCENRDPGVGYGGRTWSSGDHTKAAVRRTVFSARSTTAVTALSSNQGVQR